MLDQLQHADFFPLLDQTFTVRFEKEKSLEAKLIKVEQTGGEAEQSGRPFSLLFQVPQKDSYYTQAIYTVEHPVLGALPLFLVPLGPGKTGILYEAVFS